MAWKHHSIIHKKQGSYSCFPVLYKHGDGRLIVSLTEREFPSHYSKGRQRVFTSQDGEIWEETTDPSLKPLWPKATGKFRTELADKTWVDVGAGGMDGHADAPGVRPSSERTRWIEDRYVTVDHENDPALFYVNGKELNVNRSTDLGETWDRRSVRAPERMQSLHGFRGLQLSDGTLLFPVSGRVDDPESTLKTAIQAPWRQYMTRSTDGGQTWDWHLMAEDPTGAFTEETTLLELPGNRVLAMTRCHRPGPTGYLWQQWSADGGYTWSEPVETQVLGYPCHLLRLTDGCILCTYGYRFIPGGIRAALSPNGGWAWDMANERILRGDGGTPAQGWGPKQLEKFKERGVAGADLGYPFSEQLENGSIVTVYYITGPDRVTHVAATRWRLEGDL